MPTLQAAPFRRLRPGGALRLQRLFELNAAGLCSCSCQSVLSRNMQGHRLQQILDAVPANLHTDANEKKRRQFRDNGHRGSPYRSREAVGKSVAQKDAEGDQREAKQCCQNA